MVMEVCLSSRSPDWIIVPPSHLIGQCKDNTTPQSHETCVTGLCHKIWRYEKKIV